MEVLDRQLLALTNRRSGIAWMRATKVPQDGAVLSIWELAVRGGFVMAGELFVRVPFRTSPLW